MKKVLGCLLFGLSMISYAQDNLILNVASDDPSFEVVLPSNPTTGFQWSVIRFDKTFLTLSNSVYEKPKNNLIGAGGQMHFRFALQQGKSYPKSTEIVLKYARSWEASGATVKKVTVNFVKNGGI